jgi:hypothetical protein
MKTYLFSISLMAVLAFPILSHADGIPEEPAPVQHRVKRYSRVVEEPIPPPPACVSHSQTPKVKLVSWDPKQKVAKFLGVLHECSTNQWDVLKLLSGPNAISLRYPEEKEMWSYLWLWSYKLQNPMEETVILMDKNSKRIRKGKNPVELYLTFNKEDVLERVEMILVKKKNSNYMVVP